MINRIKSKIKSIINNSQKYTCPFCDNSSKGLSIIGFDFPVLRDKEVIGGGQRFGGCPNCGSSDRERLVYVFLKEYLNFFLAKKEKSILHIAPEKYLSKKIMEFGFDNYVCGDLFTEGYSYPKHVINLSILDIPFPENTFDLIICNHVLEHIQEDITAMKELNRVMKKGGQAILQVPISANSLKTFEDISVTMPNQREIVFGQYDHIRIYGQDYVERLEKCGFKVSRINISDNFKKFGLNKKEDVFLCEK